MICSTRNLGPKERWRKLGDSLMIKNVPWRQVRRKRGKKQNKKPRLF